MPNDSRPGFDSPAWRNDLDVLRLRSLIAHDWDHHIRQLRRSLAQHGEAAVNRLSDRDILEQAVRLVQSSRLHVARSANVHGLQFVTYRSVITPTRGACITRERPSVLESMPVAAVTAVVVQEKRYPLIVALTYHPVRAVCGRLVSTPRFKWQNEATGPETRRSGEIKSGDPVFGDLRRREMRCGDYCLEFQNAALEVRMMKQPRR